MNEKIRVTKAAGIIGSATLLSRVLGFFRDMLIAWYFGAGRMSDAFFVAFRIPSLMRRLLAEGTLSLAFVPVFTQYLSEYGKNEAFRMSRSAVRLFSVILICVVIAGVIGAPYLVKIIAPGFTGSKLTLTVWLARIMFPYVFFICMVALAMGILNVLGHFTAPALSPVFLNISMIGSIVFISPQLENPILGLAVGVLVGGLFQLLLQVPFLLRKGFYFWQKAPWIHPGVCRVAFLMGPAVFGAAVYQINILFGTLLASLLPEGSVSYLYYADRLVQFPLGIFAISTSVAVLPSLSRQAAAGDFTGLGQTFSFSLRLVFFITIPAMVGLISLRVPIVELLFGRGAFDAESIRATAYCLLFYSVGLWAFSGVRILVATFYALEDTMTPVKTGILSIAANIILGIALMGPLNHGGLALATSIASMLNLVLLIRALAKRLGDFAWKKIVVSTGKSMVSSTFMGGFLLGMLYWFPPENPTTGSELFIYVFFAITGGVVIYAISSVLLQKNELRTIVDLVKKT